MRLEGLNILYVCAYSFRYQPKLTLVFFFSLSMSAHYDNHHFIYSIFVSLFFFFPRLLFITLIAFIGDEKLSHQLIFQTLKIYFTNNLLTQKRNHNSLKENYSNHSLHLLHFLFHPSTPNISTQPAANKKQKDYAYGTLLSLTLKRDHSTTSNSPSVIFAA